MEFVTGERVDRRICQTTIRNSHVLQPRCYQILEDREEAVVLLGRAVLLCMLD